MSNGILWINIDFYLEPRVFVILLLTFGVVLIAKPPFLEKLLFPNNNTQVISSNDNFFWRWRLISMNGCICDLCFIQFNLYPGLFYYCSDSIPSTWRHWLRCRHGWDLADCFKLCLYEEIKVTFCDFWTFTCKQIN